VIAPGFSTSERHSHGAYLKRGDELWVFCARFGNKEIPGRWFSGLCAEAFLLNEKTGKFEPKGIVAQNCWPYDEAELMDNGNYIMAGQDKDGFSSIMISDGDNLLKWKTILIPLPDKLAPGCAETSVVACGKHVIAMIRGGAEMVWMATSDDYGETWTNATETNLPGERSKVYVGKLSTGQMYLIWNIGYHRDSLLIAVGKPGELTLEKAWRIRHGKSPGRYSQWSYPYLYEHDGKVYIVYTVGKEFCGLTVIPLDSLKSEEK